MVQDHTQSLPKDDIAVCDVQPTTTLLKDHVFSKPQWHIVNMSV